MAITNNTVGAATNLLTALGVGSLSSGDTVNLTYNNDDTYSTGLSHLAVDLLLVHGGGNWRGNIGVAGTPFNVDVYQGGSGMILAGWGGDTWYQGFGTGVAHHALIEVNPVKPGAKFFVVGTGQVDRVVCKRGYTGVADTADVDDLWMAGGEAFLAYHASNKTNTIRFVKPSKCTIDRDFDDAYITPGGLLVVDKSTVTPSLISLDGGDMDYVGGNITTLKALCGGLDFSRLQGPITITNMTITEAMNGRVKRPPSGIVITVTNLTQIGRNVDKWWA